MSEGVRIFSTGFVCGGGVGGRFRHDGRSGFGLNEGTILDLAYE